MIEYRLCFVNRTPGMASGDELEFIPVEQMTLYRLKGYEVFDLHESLGMEGEWVDENGNYVTRSN